MRGAAGSFDARTSDLVLRARVEAVHPNSNGRSRYRYRRYRSGSQKSGAKCEIVSRIAAVRLHVTLVAASHTTSLSLSSPMHFSPPPAAQNAAQGWVRSYFSLYERQSPGTACKKGAARVDNKEAQAWRVADLGELVQLLLRRDTGKRAGTKPQAGAEGSTRTIFRAQRSRDEYCEESCLAAALITSGPLVSFQLHIS